MYSHRGNWVPTQTSSWKQQAHSGVDLTMQCAKKCTEDPNDCRGFAFNTVNGECTLYSVDISETDAPVRTYANPMAKNFEESSDVYAYIRCKPGKSMAT